MQELCDRRLLIAIFLSWEGDPVKAHDTNVRYIYVAVGILVFAAIMLVVIPSFQMKTIQPEPGVRPYSNLEAWGRDIYAREGCFYCHSQQPRDPSLAPDGKRSWGRASTPGDYVYDFPHLLGTMRTGPDLLNIGVRQPSDDWHLVHLYQPRAVVPWSIMPAYGYLFEWRATVSAGIKPLTLPPAYAPPSGYIVPRPEALALVAYLKSLKRHEIPRDWNKGEESP